ncbi:two-partner secretion domain-containing protein [Candidatus Nitrospira salsa]
MSLSRPSRKHYRFCRTQVGYFSASVFTLLSFCTFISLGQAGVIVDGSLGGSTGAVGSGTLPNGQTLFNGATVTDHLIAHDLGTTVGSNLFHSFTELSVEAGKSATFTGPDTITNIVSRVTGSNPSQINGILASTINSANLFLLNPHGVIFGENATLDINGSFYASNSDFIQLGDNGRYYASLDENNVLTAAAPEAFGFLGATPPTINTETQATMRVESLTVAKSGAVILVGRDTLAGKETVEGIIIRGGTLKHPNGHVNLVSVGATQAPVIEQVSVNIETLFAQGINAQGDVISAPVRLGSIAIDQGAKIDTSGYGGGTVMLRGGRLTIEESKISANVTGSDVGAIGQGIDIEMSDEVVIAKASILETNVNADAASGIGSGGIRVKAERVEILGDLDTFASSKLHSDVAATSVGGNSGDIEIEANLLTQSLSIIHNRTGSIGNSGNIGFDINQDFNINFSLITTESGDSGNAGDINVSLRTGDLSLIDSGGITTQSSSSGNAGNINVSVEGGDISIENFSTVFSRIDGSGKGGSIDINAENMELNNVSSIGVENFSEQQAGELSISLTDALILAKTSFIDVVSETSAPATDVLIAAKDISVTGESLVTIETQGSANGGNLTVKADNLTLTDGSRINSEADSAGNAGNINIALTNTIKANTGGKILASTSAAGNGGNITITADDVTLTQGGTITADSTAISSDAGNAGDIALTATGTIVISDSTVTTKAVNALGGNIKLTAKDLIQFTNSDITSQVLEGSDSAGKINLDPDFVVIQNSRVLSTAVFGNGGPITIIADSAVIVDPTSTLDASSQFGGNGTIDIQAPIKQLSESLAPLPENITKIATLYAESCASQKGGLYSSFLKGTGSTTQPIPRGTLQSPLAFNESSIPISSNAQIHESQISQNVDPPKLQHLLEQRTWKIHEHTILPIPFQPCSKNLG